MTDTTTASSVGCATHSEEKSDSERVIVSYLTHRRVIGIMGLLLPVLLAGGCFIVPSCGGILDSISAYYWTEMRNVFVGILFVVGWFLFAYRGYERQDDIWGDLGCLFALGAALFPTSSGSTLVGALHFISAASLFLVFTYFSLVLFRKSRGIMTAEKRWRNRVYTWCGVIILLCIALIPIFKLFLGDTWIASLNPVFWLETFALWAFGVSWITKGETLWKDAQAHS